MGLGAVIRQITSLRTIVAGLIALAVGVLLLYVAGRDDWMNGRGGLQSVLDDLGGLLVASVTLGAIWELAGKRAFAREVMGVAKASADLTTAGITGIGTRYLTDPDWSRMFANVQKLDIFFAYGRTWRNNNDAELRALSTRRGGRIRVFLPDVNDADTVRNLAQRFQMTEMRLRDAIEESRDYFIALKVGAVAEVSVFLRTGDSTFSCYRFDDVAVLTLYSHGRRRTQVPTVVCERGGTLYNFIREEFDSIEEQSVRL